MAKYHENLIYHEDIVEKKQISAEDLEFLKKLQKEMNTQDTACQADPRYWVICGTVKEYGVSEECSDGFDILCQKSGEIVATTLRELLEEIQDIILEEYMDEKTKNTFEFVFEESDYDVSISNVNFKIIFNDDKKTILSCMDDIIEWMNEYSEYKLCFYRERQKIYPNTYFLTQKAAEKHLRQRCYDYPSDAHTYAMTALYSPEVDRLYKILRTTNWDLMSRN